METNIIKELIISSPAFGSDGYIPAKYTCEGENINPPLEVSGAPEEAETLVLIMEDPDVQQGVFDHWIVWNIQPLKMIAENSIPGVQGRNSFGSTQYEGPCPPSGTHRYYFKLYALDTTLDLPEGSKKIQLLEAMKGHILAINELIGRYKKNSSSL
jgi:Raf kinase inhibitor-like YbhB/YbcL family protein